MEEWNDIQEYLKKPDYKMKLHIKDQMWHIVFPKTKILTQYLQKCTNKGPKKKSEVYIKWQFDY